MSLHNSEQTTCTTNHFSYYLVYAKLPNLHSHVSRSDMEDTLNIPFLFGRHMRIQTLNPACLNQPRMSTSKYSSENCCCMILHSRNSDHVESFLSRTSPSKIDFCYCMKFIVENRNGSAHIRTLNLEHA